MHFRTRVFTMSILTVSAVLTLVITLSWSRIMKVELGRLDSRLCMEVKRLMPRLDEHHRAFKILLTKKTPLSGNALADDLVDKLRISFPNQLMTFVESTKQGVLMKSEDIDVKNIIQQLDWHDAVPAVVTDRPRSNATCQFAFFEYQDKQWRASYFKAPDIQSFIAVDVEATTSQLKSTLRSAMIVVIPFSFLLSIIGSWFIATNTMRPIKRLHKSMDMVTQKDLSHRLPEHKEDKEFKVLIDAYNTMLNRLEDSFQQVSRFTADAAHELKTPLTVLRGKLEQAVLNETSSTLDVNAILDEVGHLSAITRKLLLLSQADSGSMALHLETINLTTLLDQLTADMELLSDDLLLNCTIEPALIIKVDTVLMNQLFNNLLVNVIRYSLHEKGITIHAQKRETDIEILITNVCHPLSDNVRKQLFDRFYRGTAEQLQGISGSGLGLSLAREIARAHGGDLTLEASAENVFKVRLLLPIC